MTDEQTELFSWCDFGTEALMITFEEMNISVPKYPSHLKELTPASKDVCLTKEVETGTTETPAQTLFPVSFYHKSICHMSNGECILKVLPLLHLLKLWNLNTTIIISYLIVSLKKVGI